MESRDANRTTSNESSSKLIVCVYTQNDESFYRKLQAYLSLWQREKYIQWLETSAGSDIELTMQAHLQQADLILLLISPDFFAQDYCYSALQTSLQEQARRQTPVVPVLARASAWKGSPCGSLRALPRDEQPIAQWTHPEQAYEDIRSGLARLLPGDDDYREKLMQETDRLASASEPGGVTKKVVSVQTGGVAIDNKASNYGTQEVFNAPVQYYGPKGIFNAPVHIHTNSPVVSRHERKKMIDLVRHDWIRGIFERSLEGATFIPLSLYERPDLIENSWQSVLQEAKRPEHLLPPGTSITQVYDGAEGELLILGEPGSGKTTLLLQLARDLLDRASLDETQPMPVVFNLSTWAEKRQSLSEWLIGELSVRYQIPQKIGKPWVEASQVLPLLDGLDEVAAEYRGACIGAINAYRQQSLVPLVVGSRLAEYTAQTSKIVVHRAVLVQPMTLRQIHEYLEKAEGQLELLQAMLRDDPGFQKLAENPLMLSILKQTYQGKPVHIVRSASLEERRQQIFADYVQRMLQRRRLETRYSLEQTKYWLIWLAKQMKQRDQTAFYLERLQIDWLAKSRLGEISTSLAFGLLSFPVAASVYGLEFGSFLNGTLVGLLNALIAFFFVWFIETDVRVGALFSRKNRKNSISKESKRSRVRSRWAAFFTQLLGERAGFAFLSGLLDALLVEFLIGPFYALINGLFLAAFLIVLGKFERKIQPAENLVWSWKSVWDHAVRSLLLGLAIGFLGGIFDAIPYVYQVSVFLTTLFFWLSLGFALGLIIMLMRGFSSSMLDTEQVIKPNQGIRNSLSNSLRLGLSSGALLGVVIFFFYSFVIQNVFRVGYLSQLPQNADIVYGVSDAVAVAYLFWLINGGFACVQHFLLRVCLWQSRCTPWGYPHFLDYAHERILLSKVGGGYVFVHKLLLEYFASLDMVEGAYQITGESKQPEVVSPTSEMPGDIQDESRGEPTAPLIFVPVLSEVPLLLPCGHEESNPSARFCSTCGRPISAETLDQ